MFQQHHDNPEIVKLLENLTAYAEQISQKQTVVYAKNSEDETLVSDLNKVAEQPLDKADKLKLLKELIK